jgi:hypothetical protein
MAKILWTRITQLGVDLDHDATINFTRLGRPTLSRWHIIS